MRNRIGAALLIGGLVFGPGLAFAEEGGPSLEQVVVQMADTPAEHAALASYYRAKAASARAEAARHEQMSQVYTGGKFMQREQMKSHCKKLARSQTSIANEFDALAKLHEEESKKKTP